MALSRSAWRSRYCGKVNATARRCAFDASRSGCATQRRFVKVDECIVAQQELVAKVKHRAGQALAGHNKVPVSLDGPASFGTTLTGELAKQHVRVKPARWR